MIYLKLLVVLFLATFFSRSLLATPLEVDQLFLRHIEHELVNGCKYLGERSHLLEELTRSPKFKIIDAKYSDEAKNVINGFIPLPKTLRPGLSISINLQGNTCSNFILGEVLN